MTHFNFIATDVFDVDTFRDIEKFVDTYPDFQAVTLKDENELDLLLEIIGMPEYNYMELFDSEFSKLWDLSAFKLPEYNEEQFDRFYNEWIYKTHRDNNMDEYGNLIFLQGLSSKWNKLSYRLIVKEAE